MAVATGMTRQWRKGRYWVRCRCSRSSSAAAVVDSVVHARFLPKLTALVFLNDLTEPPPFATSLRSLSTGPVSVDTLRLLASSCSALHTFHPEFSAWHM